VWTNLFSTNLTVEGEDGDYISRLFKSSGIKVTRIATVPGWKTSSTLTKRRCKKALEGRREL
jgi:recombinational DNA repair protein RecR